MGFRIFEHGIKWHALTSVLLRVYSSPVTRKSQKNWLERVSIDECLFGLGRSSPWTSARFKCVRAIAIQMDEVVQANVSARLWSQFSVDLHCWHCRIYRHIQFSNANACNNWIHNFILKNEVCVSKRQWVGGLCTMYNSAWDRSHSDRFLCHSTQTSTEMVWCEQSMGRLGDKHWRGFWEQIAKFHLRAKRTFLPSVELEYMLIYNIIGCWAVFFCLSHSYRRT